MMGLVAKFVPRQTEGGDAKIRRGLAQNPPAAIAGTKSLIYQPLVTPTRQATRRRGTKDHRLMQTEEFHAAVKKFTSKGSRGRHPLPTRPLRKQGPITTSSILEKASANLPSPRDNAVWSLLSQGTTDRFHSDRYFRPRRAT